ncbi:hypothetical protein HPB48_011382 [Haemaphysalis longicornis]|uniref:Uncharacterized protein n=1 Tax=Haemaphysalis longicornis TaxID=44386 RepID=A0A9J6GDY6_HAELO|nr:hypothetical protein HPB48_011382 [Haemaphysalis longicornis]
MEAVLAKRKAPPMHCTARLCYAIVVRYIGLQVLQITRLVRSRGGVDGFLVGPVNGQLWDELDEKNLEEARKAQRMKQRAGNFRALATKQNFWRGRGSCESKF